MDEEEIIRIHNDEYEEIEPVSFSVDDDEIEFQFLIDDKEYYEVMKQLKSSDEEEEEDDETIEPIPCPYEKCKRKFTRRSNLEKHIQRHETQVKEASVCHICGKVIKGLYSLHIKTHEDFKRFSCHYCSKEFRQKVTLTNHLLIHQNKKPYSCPYCQRCFRQKYTMQSHVKSLHMNMKNFICEICDKEFSDKSTLNKHVIIHSSNKPYQCGECTMSFRHKSSLSRHSKTHLNLAKCQLCHKSFRFDTFLKKHMTVAHGISLGNDDQMTEIIEVLKEEELDIKDEYSKHYGDDPKETIIVYTQDSSSPNVLTFDSQMTHHSQKIFDQSSQSTQIQQQSEC